MSMESIALDRLRPHPRNSNVMPEALLVKLARHLAITDRYPPLIVRPVGEEYQILDGHHRAEALRRNGESEARCVVWSVDDREALLLLATLNRLEGADDPKKRAELIHELRQAEGFEEVATWLPEDVAKLERLSALAMPRPPARSPRALGDMPVAIHFFLRPAERLAVERKLREQGGSRERALLEALGIEPAG